AAGPPAALLAVAERDRAPAQAAAEVAGVEPSGAVLEPGVGGLGAPQLALDARPHPLRPFGALALGHPVRDPDLKHARDQAGAHGAPAAAGADHPDGGPPGFVGEGFGGGDPADCRAY